MNCTLHNFCSHSHSTFYFEHGSFTYISGKSGSGKSTIFTAIQWVLFGKIKNVLNFRYSGGNTWVEISTSKYTIQRRKNPDYLYVLDKEKNLTFEAKTAQEYINTNIYTEDVFIASSYLEQDAQHFFFSKNANSQQQLINTICFKDKDPEKLISCLSNKIKKESENLKENKIRRDVKYNDLVSECKNTILPNPNDWSKYFCSNQEIQHKQEEISNVYFELEKKRKQHQESISIYAAKKVYLEQKHDIEVELKSLPESLTKEEIEQLIIKKDNIVVWNQFHEEFKKYMKQKDDLLVEIRGLEKFVEEHNLDDLISKQSEAKQRKIMINKNKIICRKYSVEWNKKDIINKINHLKHVLDNQELRKTIEQNKQIQFQINQLKSSIQDVEQIDTIKEIDELDLSISSFQNDQSKYQIKLTELSNQKNKLNSDLREKIDQIKSKFAFQIKKEEEENKKISVKFQKQILQLKVDLSASQREDQLKKTCLTCPSCQDSLLLQDNKLILLSEVASNKDSKTQEIQQLIEKSQKGQDNENEITKQTISVLNNKMINQINKIKSEINTLLNEIIKKETEVKTQISDINGQIKQLQDKKICFKQQDQNQKQNDKIKIKISTLEDQIKEVKNVDVPLLSQNQISKYNSEILSLQIVLNDGFDIPDLDQQKISETISKLNKYKILSEKLENLKDPKKPQSKEEIGDITKISNQISSAQTINTRKFDLISRLSLANQKINKFPSIEDPEQLYRDIQNINLNIKTKEDEISLNLFATKVSDKYLEINKQDSICKSLQSKINLLDEIKNETISLRNYLIDKQIIFINSFMKEAIPKVFDFPMKIELKTNKELKNGKHKDCICVYTEYKGGSFYGIQPLSGGEKSRVSTLFLIAVNKIVNSDFFIIDEVVSKLDCESREQILSLIRDELPNRFLMSTCHDSCLGNYDAEYSMEDYSMIN